MQGVILAAGRGSRMQGLTVSRPKAMLPIVGLPIVARVVEQLRDANITQIVIVVSADDADIRPYFEQNPLPGVSLTFAVQPHPAGMAHALLQAMPHITGSFIVTACDSLYPPKMYGQLADTHRREGSPATLALMSLPPEVIPRASSVEFLGDRVARIVEKPSLADAPSHIGSLALYAFDLGLLDYLQQVKTSARGEMELQDAIQMMITEHGALPGVMTDWRWELTIPTDLLELNLWWLQKYFQPDMTFVETGVDIPKDTILESGVYIEAGAMIGARAHLKNSVVLRDGVVSAGEIVTDALVSAAIEVE